MSTKTVVGIIFGGRSVEHQISIRSALNVYQYIDNNKYDIELIGIDKTGKWHHMPEVDGDFSKGQPINLILDPVNPRFTNSQGSEFSIDIAFPVLHGTDGEDGSIQGLLTAMNIPFAGSGVLGSAMAMDKLVSKLLLKEANIPVSKFIAFNYSERDDYSYSNVSAKIGVPFMVKPVNLGSSVGVNKVKNEADYYKALEETFKYDQEVLLEEYIQGRELECAILGNANVRGSHPGEIVINEGYEFYTYEAKYEDENAVDLQIPASVDDTIAEQIKELCIKSYKALKCSDFARVDLFLTPHNEIYINEINTIPGFTNVSMFPSLWGQHGIEYSQLLTEIIDMAVERYQKKQSVERSYQSKN